MNELVILITAVVCFVLGWGACHFASRSANEQSRQAFDSLVTAWNARFAPKAKAMSTVDVQQSVVGESSVVSDPAKPIKTVPEWNINALRQSALQEIADREKSINESLQRLP